MQDLYDLIEFIQKTKFKSNTLLDALIKPDSQMGKVMHAIARKEALSDQDLLDLFPELSNLSNITTLKTRLKNRLCDAVFLLDFREERLPDRQIAFVECAKRWSSAMILITKNIRSIGVKQMENLLRHTLDFEFTELSMNIIRTLEIYYATIEGNQRKYSELDIQLNELESIWLAEREVERLYTDLMINYVNSRSGKHLVAEKAKEYYDRILPHLERFPAFKIQFFGFLIQTIIHDSKNDYAGMEKVCLDAVAFFDRKPYRSGMALQTFYYNIITCSLYTRRFERGQLFVLRMEELLESNSFNWFKLQELYFLMAMHTENYNAAFDALSKTLSNNYLQAQPMHVIEIWKIYEAYIQFLIITGHISEDKAKTEQTNFKINRFLNEVQLLAKDKRGMNISVLIIQFLFFVVKEKYEECEGRTDALKKYSNRYLNDAATVRSRIFIKLLLQIPACSFDQKCVRQKTAESYQNLEDIPWHTVNQHREIEIIPYEHLWLILLESLKAPPLPAKVNNSTVKSITKPEMPIGTSLFKQDYM